MLTKFETRSNRVKGIAFHPKRSWVLCGLHNGAVQLWDYRMGSALDRFEEHEGPVRGVDFHHQQPLFVTGGDDYKIKVWNYKLRRCLFTLLGHLDYIRTVQFHKDQPWIVSSSDDQTLRIWNWQSRNCVSVLTGHNHYVMSALFHPREDLIVSASLDLTLRVWDVSGLRSKKQDSAIALPQDLFGSNDVVVKFILEGHEKGVNWASFHPTKPFIVSCADDRSIRIWKMDDTRTYEVEQLRGHTSNVSCVMYFRDLIVSNSEDRTIRVWDSNIRSAIHTFRRDNDRFWVLSVNPENNLLAAGHDTGMVVFKLERERPAHAIHNGILYWIKERTLRTYDFETGAETSPMTLRRHNAPPVTLSCNPADNQVVLWYDYDGGIFELFNVPKGGGSASEGDVKKGFYCSAVFFAANKFAVLDKTRQIVIRTTGNDITKVLPAVHDADKLFAAPQGCILCRAEDKVYLFNIAQKGVVAEANAAKVRYAIWDKEWGKVILQSKHDLVVANRKLRTICTVHESTRIKSACFDEERDVVIYTTLNHLKYCSLRNGDTGTLRTLDSPIYLVRSSGDTIWYMNRDAKVVQQTVDNMELNFKLALQQERFKEVLRLIQTRKVHGQALVAYLHKQGYPEIAMHFVSDPFIRFNLAIECGTLDVAKTTAQELNKKDCWQRLADCAMKFGDIQLAQYANARQQNLHGQAMACVLTGNKETLSHLITNSRDENFVAQYSIVSGDVEQRVKMMEAAGQLPLAFSLARNNGLDEVAEALLEKMSPEVAEKAKNLPFRPVKPAREVAPVTENWPTLPVQESFVSRMLKEPGLFDYDDGAAAVPKAGGAWGDDGLEDELEFGEAGDGLGDSPAGDGLGESPGGSPGMWDDELEIDLPNMPSGGDGAAKGAYVVPRDGDSAAKHWSEYCQVAAHQVAAGNFNGALDMLRRQIGLADATPLLPYVMQLWSSCNGAKPTWSILPSHAFHLSTAPAVEEMRAKHYPKIPGMMSSLADRVKQGYQATTDGRFPDAHRIFSSILHQIPFVVVETRAEAQEVRDLMNVAREYVSALNVEVTRKETTEPSRMVELAAYFTHYKLQSTHQMLGMGQAMSQAFKTKNLRTAGVIARRLLELDPPPDRAEKARKVIQMSDQNPNDALTLDYNDRNPFTICVVSKVPMYRGTVDPVKCPFCTSAAKPEFRGKICPVCKISKLGSEGSGLISSVAQIN